MAAPGSLVRLCHIDQIEDGCARGFDPYGDGRDLLFLVRRGEVVKAYLNKCPHQEASLPWRKHEYLNSDGSRVVCSAHGAQFDIDSGRCLLGPALGRSLEPIAIAITDSGAIQAHLPVRP